MSTDALKEPITETSPQVYARIGGVLYLEAPANSRLAKRKERFVVVIGVSH